MGGYIGRGQPVAAGGNSVETSDIVDDAITNDKIATNAVTGDSIASNAVGNSELSDNAVNTAEIAADAVTGAKIADDAVESEHIAAGAVDNAHLATGIASSKLTGALPAIDGASLTGISAADNTPSFGAKRNSPHQNFTAINTVTKVVLDNELWDTDNAYDTTTSRFTVPTGEGGRYHFSAGCGFSRLYDTDEVYAYIKVNNAYTYIDWQFKNTSLTYSSVGHTDPSFTMSGDLDLSAGDYVEFFVWTNGNGIYNDDDDSVILPYTTVHFSGFKLAGV